MVPNTTGDSGMNGYYKSKACGVVRSVSSKGVMVFNQVTGEWSASCVSGSRVSSMVESGEWVRILKPTCKAAPNQKVKKTSQVGGLYIVTIIPGDNHYGYHMVKGEGFELEPIYAASREKAISAGREWWKYEGAGGYGGMKATYRARKV